MQNFTNTRILPASSLALICALGCVDPSAKFESFVNRTTDAARLDRDGAVTPPDGPLPDARPTTDGPAHDAPRMADGPTSRVPNVTGPALLATAVIINPDVPLQFLGHVTLHPNADGVTATMDLSVVPLRVSDRTPLAAGPEISTLGVAVAADLSFTADLGDIAFPGEANPISGGNVAAHLILKGRIVSADLICGDVEGMVNQPVSFDAAGSTFAFTRVAEGATGAALPSPPRAACP